MTDHEYDLSTPVRPAGHPALDPEIKARWVAALRDGRSQTIGALKRLPHPESGRPPGQCCLGVLCEIAAEEGVVDERPDSAFPHRVTYGQPNDYFESMILPRAVRDWAGLRDGNPDVIVRWKGGDGEPGEVVRTCLAELNDGGVSFDEIADLIEEAF